MHWIFKPGAPLGARTSAKRCRRKCIPVHGQVREQVQSRLIQCNTVLTMCQPGANRCNDVLTTCNPVQTSADQCNPVQSGADSSACLSTGILSNTVRHSTGGGKFKRTIQRGSRCTEGGEVDDAFGRNTAIEVSEPTLWAMARGRWDPGAREN